MSSVYVIAEAGVNHNGRRDLAFELIDAAASAGADAVKFQTFDAKKLASTIAPKARYQTQSTGSEESQLEMLKALELPRSWHVDLKTHAQSKKIEFLSTAFDLDSLEFLQQLGVQKYKIPSGELINASLMWHFAQTGKDLIVSTGMATLGEVEFGLAVLAHGFNSDSEPATVDEVWRGWSNQEWRESVKKRVILLHCTSQYPTPLSEVNLRAMDVLSTSFGTPVGYSDHTEGTLVPVMAVARGAKVVEKHFTLDRSFPGPDHAASLEPDELNSMVQQIRQIEVALGSGVKAPQPSEWDTRLAVRQQVVAARDIIAGATIRREDLTTSRCGAGISASELWNLIGTKARADKKMGEPL
ncbi:N-acetylneuraminate synthase [Sedimenticola sp.]|uniref:N-acetylneuraminate synthase n=1 Tax=Sedimenticola sp. TaxID=1940285 RepID=UPI003D10BD5F